ncbi:hypothetical protein BDY21DRAFT_75415 [Lineolata rhizophorae]|uniref:Uncharacterized protein n=1 Tax=Lineolata rhizophorae TaxID=578093 RepID=A0A6A6NVB9_9PEZI|nr:hypothetical protein BDY21DRAFT_75415 [Lineolata rhizophorae]
MYLIESRSHAAGIEGLASAVEMCGRDGRASCRNQGALNRLWHPLGLAASERPRRRRATGSFGERHCFELVSRRRFHSRSRLAAPTLPRKLEAEPAGRRARHTGSHPAG